MPDQAKLHQTFKLKDGRNLGYAEYGDLNGKPMFHFHGSPACRLETTMLKEDLTQYGVRIISVDRPGIGLSDFKPRRKLLDWPNDIIELADHLGLGNFAVYGGSAGGPYAAVCAYKLPNIVTCCVIAAGVPPPHIQVKTYSSKLELFVSRCFPFLVKKKMQDQLEQIDTLEKIRYFINAILESMSEVDKEAMNDKKVIDNACEMTLEAYKQGVKGHVLEQKIFASPWGFKLKDISPDLQVYLWHGEDDKNIPILCSREMGKLIPKCEEHYYLNEGHLSLSFKFFGRILEQVRLH
jgi:pimeloyl-ACP methyl ester carboxylesterase